MGSCIMATIPLWNEVFSNRKANIMKKVCEAIGGKGKTREPKRTTPTPPAKKK